jgi:uncharacterized protein
MNPGAPTIRISVTTASRWWQRLRGLLGSDPLPRGQGLLLAPCRAVHTLGLGWPIDVAFLDRHGVVLSLRRGLGVLSVAMCRNAHAALELRAGEIARLGLWVGCRVECVEESAR